MQPTVSLAAYIPLCLKRRNLSVLYTSKYTMLLSPRCIIDFALFFGPWSVIPYSTEHSGEKHRNFRGFVNPYYTNNNFTLTKKMLLLFIRGA